MAKMVSAHELFSTNLTALSLSISVSRSIAATCRQDGHPEIAEPCEEWVALMESFIRECGLGEDYDEIQRVIEEKVARDRRLPSGTFRKRTK